MSGWSRADESLLVREHDLPPKWDGRIVEWTGWEPSLAPVFICPPPRVPVRDESPRRCEYARGTNTERNVGIVAVSPATTQADLDYENENRRLLGGAVGKRPLLAYRRLVVTRCCHVCCQDAVYDMDTDELWDLDDTDYGDEGSVAPTEGKQ